MESVCTEAILISLSTLDFNSSASFRVGDYRFLLIICISDYGCRILLGLINDITCTLTLSQPFIVEFSVNSCNLSRIVIQFL